MSREQFEIAHGAWIATLTWPEVAERLERGAIAVLPVGAAAKEHGLHLPLGTDCIQAEWLGEWLTRERDVLVWPTLSYGFYPVFVDYPGSVSVGRATFTAMVSEILSSIAAAGAQKITVLNTGISTIEPLQRAVEQVGSSRVVRIINVYSGPAFAATTQQVATQKFGGHADEIETSIMLALNPEYVRMQYAEVQSSEIKRGLFNRYAPHAENYSPSGGSGDPTSATADKGHQLMAAIRHDVLIEFDSLENLR